MSRHDKKHLRNKKSKAYGQKRALQWCIECDRYFCPPAPSKKAERQKAKRQIKKDI